MNDSSDNKEYRKYLRKKFKEHSDQRDAIRLLSEYDASLTYTPKLNDPSLFKKLNCDDFFDGGRFNDGGSFFLEQEASNNSLNTEFIRDFNTYNHYNMQKNISPSEFKKIISNYCKSYQN